MRYDLSKIFFALAFLLNCPLLLFAQASSTAGAIIGTVKDGQGAAIVGATITARQLETNLQRTTQLGEDGLFQMLQLPPGRYEVVVQAEGFTGNTITVRVDIGRTEVSKFTLLAEGSTEVIEVSASDNLGELKTEGSTNINRNRIENLPINERNFLDFSLITAGVTRNRVPANGPTATSGLSFNGQTARQNNITIDGLDNNEPASGNVRSTFSQDAVQEFQVVAANYSAEFGRAIGGVVNIVTRGGTNEFHGTLFQFSRNDAISARDAFAPIKPEFRQYQFGATLGGPIKKDKAFFFTSFERLTVKQNNFVVISDQLVNSARKLGFDITNGPVPFARSSTQLLARSDIQLSPADRLTLRYNYGTEFDGNFQPFGELRAQSSAGINVLDDQSVALSNTYVSAGLNLVNETRLLISRRDANVLPYDNNGPNVSVIAPEGQIVLGREPLLPQELFSRYYNIVNNVSLDRGKHQIKTGIDFYFVRVPEGGLKVPVLFSGAANFAAVDFAQVLNTPGLPFFTAAEFFDPDLRSPAQQVFLGAVAQALPTLFPGFPRNVPLTELAIPIAYLQGFGNSSSSAAVNYLSGFVQDDLRLRPNLLIKAGLRYDRESIRFAPKNRGNFSPRIGFSYQPARFEKLAISGSYGIFHGTTQYSAATISTVLNSKKVLTSVLSFPFSILPFALPGHHFPESTSVPAGIPIVPQLGRITMISPSLKNGYAQQGNFAVNYLLNPSSNITVSYQFVRGLKVLLARNINPVVRPIINDPVTSAITGRIDTNQGEVISFETSGDSYYNALTVGIRSQVAQSFSILAHYTYSKAIDNAVDALRIDIVSQQDPLNLKAERSLSLQDVRSRFVFSSTYDSGARRNQLLRDWQVSTIITLNSGQPFNLLAGVDLDGNGDTSGPADRPNRIGRNMGRGPGFTSFDLRFSRAVSIKERIKITGYAEVFNLFNRVNIDKVNGVFSPRQDGSFALPPQNGGSFIATPDRFVSAFRPRQFQLGVRVNF